MKAIKERKKWRKLLFLLLLFLLVYFVFCLPSKLFIAPTSTILYSVEGQLLGARIAKDGQWRFPAREKAPDKFAQALLCFEDRYFYKHPGVNPFALLRAVKQNITSGRIVSGGSTISMQLIRLSRQGKSRTYYQKFVEVIQALRLELRYSKQEILAMYASYAPFGGNVVGVDAAAWRYFGRSAEHLSWAEAATLAVLPNAPSLIFPGRNSQILKEKRNRLLDRMQQDGVIDSVACVLAKLEDIPRKIDYLPHLASHLLDRADEEYKGAIVQTSIKRTLQKQVNNLLKSYKSELEANKIQNAAVLVAEVATGKCIAYVGNFQEQSDKRYGQYVDVIRAERSTGSILKPFLFTAMLEEGELLQTALEADIPTQIGNYAPENFNLKYTGAIPAREALVRSLNVPAVRMLRRYGVERFHFMLKKWGMTTLKKTANHYGLSLILGGAEGTLWDIVGMYASMGRLLNNYTQNEGRIDWENTIYSLSYRLQDTLVRKYTEDFSMLPKAGAIYNTLDALLEVKRPDQELGWQTFSSSQKIAWKTGTSFGFRDAWAVGVTPKYVVGVWVGNASGVGRSGLTGVSKAAPIMFDVFDLLPKSKWFAVPYDDMEEVVVCRKSGFLSGRWCEEQDTILVAQKGVRSASCPYHHLLHLDKQKLYQVNLSCEPQNEIVHQSWFVLPPAMEWYYKRKHPLYRPLPPFREDCLKKQSAVMELIYPRENKYIFVPKDLDGSFQKLVFELTHNQSDTEVFWHLDEKYLGSTKDLHQMELRPSQGKHLLTLIDERGNMLQKVFVVVDKNEKSVN